MKGIINVRDSVVPVVDLRVKLGLEDKEDTVDTCIVVLELDIADEMIVVGVRVDSVEEVIELYEDNIEPPPKFGFEVDTEYIQGIGKKDDQFVILLNLKLLFSDHEINVIKKAESKIMEEKVETASVRD
jgi:purine-binding chemotaxis protein CheW